MTARGEPWSDFEMQCLYDVINDADWYRHAARLITRRSEGAIRTKMSILRDEAGIVIGTRAGAGNRAKAMPESERAHAAQGSAKLLKRLIEVHAPRAQPAPRERTEVQLAFLIGPLFDRLELAA